MCFAIFGKNSKSAIFGETKIAKIAFLRSPVGRIALSRTVKEIEANLCFAILGKKFENSKWQILHFWVENFDEIALSRTVKEIEANLCFAKIAFLRYPVGRKFRRNRSISHG